MLMSACLHVHSSTNIDVTVNVTRRLDMDPVYRQAADVSTADDAADAAFGIENVTRRAVEYDQDEAF